MGLVGTTNEEKIWNFLKGNGFTEHGVAGLMGNLYAESGLKSNNLQNAYEKKLGLDDIAYTSSVDAGSYSNFIKDCAGYGLAQWTHWSRKEKLLTYAKQNNKSVGDLEMQLEFLMQELKQSFKAVVSILETAQTVQEASDCVLLKFERPADQSEAAKIRRAGYGQKYYDKYAAKEAEDFSIPSLNLETPTISQTTREGYITHIVQEGETLSKISKQYGLTYQEVAKYNSISNPNLIKAGQAIKIPKEWTPKIGDTVMFNGPGQYYSPNSIFGKFCKPGKAKIAEIRDLGKSKHPYRLQYIPGGGSDITKWVDEGTFTKI